MHKAANGVFKGQKCMSASQIESLSEKINLRQVKKAEKPPFLSWPLIEGWAGINSKEVREGNWGWKKTPLIPIKVDGNGESHSGEVFIKDESVNPTGTFKIRMGWEVARLYAEFAKLCLLRKEAGALDGNLEELPVPSVSIISAGSAASAISYFLKKWNLPPMNVLLDSSISKKRLENLVSSLHANIYTGDLSRKNFSPEEIRALTGNKDGIEITSIMLIQPQRIFYDWHAHEAFNESPCRIFIPYGSGRLFENYLNWQWEGTAVVGQHDARLEIAQEKLSAISILAATPEKLDSIAVKLTAKFNPYALFGANDIAAMRMLGNTGKETGVYKISDYWIWKAHEIIAGAGVKCEQSAAAGLGLWLYIHRKNGGVVPDQSSKDIIVNTGLGA
ncbi:Pyridoxal-phosphate dependent enzyme [uncultured archaeon]|nr:Pyridoxal-phosphate dependent enzyme [uncultured archaeon]